MNSVAFCVLASMKRMVCCSLAGHFSTTLLAASMSAAEKRSVFPSAFFTPGYAFGST